VESELSSLCESLLLVRNLVAALLCWDGWQESLGDGNVIGCGFSIDCVGFLWTV
jgi:hypothetical protein